MKPDKCIICISLRYTLSNGQKLVYKILISEQIALAAMFFFEQVFAFCMLINKNVGMVSTNNM